MSNPELVRALSDLTLAVRGGLQMTTITPRRDASVYNSGYGSISGTGTLACWSIGAGRSFVLKGYVVTAVVEDTLAVAGGAAGILYFFDDDDSDRVVAPIGAFDGDAAIGVSCNRDVPDLGSGVRGSAAGSDLKIKFNQDITSGNIGVAWCVWGDEVNA